MGFGFFVVRYKSGQGVLVINISSECMFKVS